MDNEICNRIVAKYEDLERTGYGHHLAIQLSLVLGILIFLGVLIWTLNVPDYIKFIGSIAMVIVIMLLAYYVGKFYYK